MTPPTIILVLNVGSSSLKLAAFQWQPDSDQPLRLILRGRIERTRVASGENGVDATLRLRVSDETTPEEYNFPVGDSPAALQAVAEVLRSRFPDHTIAAFGHRVVHGGSRYTTPVAVTPDILPNLEALVPLAPLHQPHNLAGIREAATLFPDVPQIACFDTAFHATLPRLEQMFGLPRRYYEQGIRRYGFHGLSYASIAHRLPEVEPRAATGRTVVCHLGSGASVCALLAGKSIATTMSFTPLDGLLMGTRAGAIDPGVLLYLQRQEGLSPDTIERLLDQQSGLLGISGISADMRDLIATPSPAAREAVDLFCYRLVREIGSMVAVLGGLDTVVFTGGIGEYSPPVRQQVCGRLNWLGIELDAAANAANASRLNTPDSRVSVLRMTADEESLIARQVAELVSRTG